MQWYQINYCLPGRSVWHIDGGNFSPRKYYDYNRALEREAELCKRHPGLSTMIVRLTEVQFSDLATQTSCTMTQYEGVF